jgi:hypothetical protein
MSLERYLSAVAPVAFTANGGEFGQVTVSSTTGFFVKQIVIVQAPSLPPLKYEVKRVVSVTNLILGTPGNQMQGNANLLAYTVSAGSFIYAEEQPKAKIDMESRLYASYIQEPINAWRTQNVDENGNPYTDGNPMPVAFDGTISIGQVEVKGTNNNIIEPNADGSINVVVESAASQQVINQFQELSIVPGSTGTIITYTAPTGQNTSLQKVSVSGENIARFDVQVNGLTVEVKRTYWGNFNEIFNFMTDSASGGYPLNPGDIVTVIAQNYSPDNITANYDARIQLVTAPIQS